MTDQIIERVATWNYVRSNTDYDKFFEQIMLDEEVEEYGEAEDIANEAKELADIVFVALGSLYKFTGSAEKVKEIMDIVINHNDNKGYEKDENGKVIKVQQPSCEPSIKEVLDRKIPKQGSLFED